MIYVIGCGGVTSYMLPVLVKLLNGTSRKACDSIVLIDGDKLEEKNLDRQLFDAVDIGVFKCEALAAKCKVKSDPSWFSESLMEFEREDVLMVMVDNHPARIAALECVDRYKCRAIIAANEQYSAESYAYLPQWQDSPLDPRKYYPEMNTDHSGDPRRAAIGCTGEAQETNRQLATANFTAASLAMHLFQLWIQGKFDKEVYPNLPFKLVSNRFGLETHRVGDTIQQTETKG